MRQIDEQDKYRYLEHSADVKIHGQGKDLPTAFAHTALGMLNLIVDTNTLEESQTKKIAITAPRITALLYDFLNELLSEIETASFIAKRIEGTKIIQTESGFTLTTRLYGQSDVPQAATHEIKSPTYNEMCLEVDEVTKHFHIHVVLDI